jgi:hypothetical protein
MTTLRDLLEVYGALDRAVGQSDSPHVAATVDSFIPNFSANTGWYDELERYFFGESARRQPDLAEACSRIGKASRAAQPATGNGDPGQGARAPRLTVAQKSRLFYGLTTATRLQQVGQTKLTAMPDEYLMYAYLEALAAVQSDDQPYDDRLEVAREHFDPLWEHVKGCGGRGHFRSWRAQDAASRLVESSMHDIPLCNAKVVTIEGIPVVVVDTDLYAPNLHLADVTSIVNPFNWNENYPDFFISMDPCGEPERTDGWFRVLETVGFRGLGGLELRTALKYHSKLTDTMAHIDYDLDDPTPGLGDGKVIVDRGFINITVDDPDQPGVRARTRKVVHIDGLSPYAQQRLVCLTGYGTASAEFLFSGRANAEPPYPRDFGYYKDQTPQADPTTDAPVKSSHVAATAVKLWGESAEGMVSDYFELAEKWMDGRLRLRDVADYSAQTTGRLVSAPLEFWERVSQPQYLRGQPRRPSGTGDDAQGGGSA